MNAAQEARLTLSDMMTGLIDLLEESEMAGPTASAELEQHIRNTITGARHKIDGCSAVLAELDARAEACAPKLSACRNAKPEHSAIPTGSKPTSSTSCTARR